MGLTIYPRTEAQLAFGQVGQSRVREEPLPIYANLAYRRELPVGGHASLREPDVLEVLNYFARRFSGHDLRICQTFARQNRVIIIRVEFVYLRLVGARGRCVLVGLTQPS